MVKAKYKIHLLKWMLNIPILSLLSMETLAFNYVGSRQNA